MTGPFIALLLLSCLYSPSCHGFASVKSPTPTRVLVPSLFASTTSPPINEEEEATKTTANNSRKIDLGGKVIDLGKILDRDNDNIDDVRRARSLARRDRLAQWRATAAKVEDNVRDEQDNYFLLAAFLPAIIAFFTWGNISIGLAKFLNIVGVVNSAEGNAFANNLLRPTIIGVVVPVISIALATLVSTTVNVLRQRQVDLRAFINQEVGELRFLRRAVFGMYGTRQHAGRRARALALLCGYVEQLMGECKDGAVEELEEIELTGGIAANELDRFLAMLHGVDGAAAARQGSVSAAIELILSLNSSRSKRVALLLTDFPAIHWDVVAGLNISVIIAFLLTSNQPVLQYLDSIQLRFMFAIIVGVASGQAILCWDLDNPFSGTFSIAGASTQLADLRVCLREDVREAVEESQEISSSTRDFFRAKFGGPTVGISSSDGSGDENSSRYGLMSTIYFHLLTSPVGSYLILVSDALAWLATSATRWFRKALISWRRFRWRKLIAEKQKQRPQRPG